MLSRYSESVAIEEIEPSDVIINDNMQMMTTTKSKSVSFSFLSRPTYPVLLLIFYLQQEIKLEWPNNVPSSVLRVCSIA